MNKPLLVVVDVQKDFMIPNGLLYVKGAEDIIGNIKKLIELCPDCNILFTSDSHYENAKEISTNPDFINTFPRHCIKNTDGVLLVDEIRKNLPIVDWEKIYTGTELDDLCKNRELLLLKDQFDMFTNPNTDKLIARLNPSEIYVCGVVEGVCVKFAVDGFLDRNYKVTVFEDCIKNLEHLPSELDRWDSMGACIEKIENHS